MGTDEVVGGPDGPAAGAGDGRSGKRRAVRAGKAHREPSLPDTDAEHAARTDAADARTDAASDRTDAAEVRATAASERISDRTIDAADRAADALDRTADAADRSADSIDRFAATARAAVETASKSVAQLRAEHSESVARTDAIGETLADRASVLASAEHIAAAAEQPAAIVNPERIAEHIARVGKRFDTLTDVVNHVTDGGVVNAPVVGDGGSVGSPPRRKNARPKS